MDSRLSGADEIETGTTESLPERFREEVVHRVGDFATVLFGIRGTKDRETLHFVGSGTFVTFAETHFILTAAHVWKALKSFDEIAITLKELTEHSFRIPSNAIDDLTIAPEHPEEWGPDLSFLRIPTHFLGTIEAYRVFYNLGRREPVVDSGPDVEMGAWVLMGSPHEAGKFTETHAELLIWGGFTGVQAVHKRGKYDYLDVGVKLSLPDLPSGFGGISGGGLWQVLIARSERSGEFSIDDIALEGVAFYESSPDNGRRIIRCHGRQSIYTAIRSWKQAV